jgi:hypothetical protein
MENLNNQNEFKSEEDFFNEAFGIKPENTESKEEEVPMFNPSAKVEDNREPNKEEDEDSFEKALGIEGQTKDEPTISKKDVDYKSIYKYKVENEGWAEIENEDELDWDEETFNAIVSEQKKAKKEDKGELSELEEFWNNVQDKSWLKKQLINETTIKDVDTSDPDQSISLLSYYYVQSGRMSEKDFDKLMSSKTDDELSEMADEKKDEIVSNIKETMKQRAYEDMEAKKNEEKIRKDYEKQFVEVAKQRNKTDSQAKKMLREIMPNNDGSPSALTMTIIEKLRDPKEALMVYEFFMNPDAFVNNIESKAKKKIILESINKKSDTSKQYNQPIKLKGF